MWTALIFIVYISFLAWFGLRGRRVESLRDFVLAGDRLGPLVLGVSFASSYASSSLFLGVSGWAYSWGEAVLFYDGAIFFCSLAGLLFFVRRFHALGGEQGSITLAHWLGDRYGSKFLRIGVGSVSIFNLFYIAGQLIGIAYLLSTLFPIPFFVAVLLGAGLAALFVSLGGMYTNVRTDFLQGTVMMLVVIAVVGKGLMDLPGGIAGMHAGLREAGPQFVSLINRESPVFDSPLALGSIVWLLFIFVANPHLMAIILVLRKPKDYRIFIASAGLTLFIYQLIPISGLIARARGLEVSRADAVLPEMLAAYYPPVFTVLVGIAILAASFTTINSLLVATSGIIANDLVGQLPTLSGDRRRLLVSRLAVGGLALAATAVALRQPPSLTLLVWIGINGVLSGVTGPLIFGLFRRRASRRAAVVSFCGGLSSYLVLYPAFIDRVLIAGAAASLFGFLLIAAAEGITVLSRRRSSLPASH